MGSSMINRRKMFAMGVAPMALVPTAAKAAAEPFCINPYGHNYATAENILLVEFVMFDGDERNPLNWLNVYLRDAKHVEDRLQTELLKHQNFLPMLYKMKSAGVTIKTVAVGRKDILR